MSVRPGWSMPNANTVILRRDVIAYGLDAFSAWTEVTVKRDGTVRFHGSAHDSGLEGYDFHICTIVRLVGSIAIAMQHSGRVEGTLSGGSHNVNWDETQNNQLIAVHFDEVQNCWIEVAERHEGDIFREIIPVYPLAFSTPAIFYQHTYSQANFCRIVSCNN